MCDSTVEFSVLASMFDAVVRAKKSQLKRKHVRTFLDHVYTDHEFFSAMRLMLPNLDKERGNYGLKEAVLAKCLAEALCLSKESDDAQKLLHWRKGGTRAGSNAGNFSFVATEILCRRQRVTSTGLKIKDVNELLDRLAAAERREDKVAVLAEMINKTNSQEMRWIIMIILKDLKLGISEKAFFSEFHPDAEDLFNVTCDLKLVCEKLRNRNERYDRQDIEVGKAVRPQLASRVANVEEAWKKLRGKQVIVECKFDGDRIQIHKNGSTINFFSRNFIDHQIYKEGMADLIIQNVLSDKCILDGEMLVYDRSTKRFADFGTNREAAKAAKEGLESSQQYPPESPLSDRGYSLIVVFLVMLQLCYVAFDILYTGHGSVIHLPLRERQQLLAKAVKPLQGRLELLLPNNGTERKEGDSKWSFVASRAEEVEHFFALTVENREEGIILKDLDSKWEPSDRSSKWLKLKPDYVRAGSDLDVLIIGGYYGSGKRGGQIAQFLLGLAETPKSGSTNPSRFVSFCRVGTGLTDEESDHLVQKLKPYFRRYEKNTKPPDCYIVTNNSKERPDVWVEQPDKSVILEIMSDIRTIKTEVFAAPFGLRFPRIHRVRYDKPWYECLSVQALVDLVQQQSGSTVDSKQLGGKETKARQVKRQKKPEARFMPLVPLHMRITDVSQVKRSTQIFDGVVFYFANYPEEYTKENLHKLVVENGGSFSMNLNDEVTHAIACERKGIKYIAAASHRDVIHHSWIMDCCAVKSLLPVKPKYYLHLSAQTKDKMKAEIDEYGDVYYLDIDTNDLKQLFENVDRSKLATDIDELAHYKKKYCPSSTFCQFSNCVFYFHKPIHSRNVDSQVVAETALMRQRLEVSMRAGTVAESLTRAVTHMIVYTSPNQSLSFRTIFKSVAPSERRLLMSDKLKILSHQWIDDHVPGTCGHPSQAKYDLRDPSFKYEERDMEPEKPGPPAIHEDTGSNAAIEHGTSNGITETSDGVTGADGMLATDEGKAGNQGISTSRLVTLPKVARGANRKRSLHGNEETDNGKGTNVRLTRSTQVKQPKVAGLSNRKTLNHRINDDKSAVDREPNRPAKRSHDETVAALVRSSDVPEASGSKLAENCTAEGNSRSRLVTLPKVSRAEKRRKSHQRQTDAKLAEDKNFDGEANPSNSVSQQGLEGPVDTSATSAELASDKREASDSKLLKPDGISSSSLRVPEVDNDHDSPPDPMDFLLGGLIPSYSSSQRDPTVLSTLPEAGGVGKTRSATHFQDSKGSGDGVNTVASTKHPEYRPVDKPIAGASEAVVNNLVSGARTAAVDVPVTKKKVSYKNLVNSLLKNPP
ncbi:hypothetical protein R1sor_002753 [Riccia sorocarpa]|uniref:DNA ligase n=1 Tax=Riccia sorocarpa TaxID=122646 RepID=A0ABD3H3V1_9MARC